MGRPLNSKNAVPKFSIGDIVVGAELIEFVYELSEGKEHNVKKWICKVPSGIVKIREDYLIHISKKPSHKFQTTKDPKQTIKNRIFRTYKSHARDRNLVFDLTKETFCYLLDQNCFYCQTEPIGEMRENKTTLKYNGIDRKNNKIGYIESNCVTCCKICNQAKMDMEYEEFLKWIKKLKQFCSLV